MNISIPNARIFASLGVCLLFAGAFYQAPLFSSNQNTYFLNGLVHAGYGYLSTDWLAHQTDHIPVFSWLVSIVHSYGGDWMFYVLFAGLATLYAHSLSAIVARTFGSVWRWSHLIVFLALVTLFHCAWILTPIAELIPGMHYLIPKLQKVIELSTSGVAGQSILKPILQPSTFGVLILSGIAFFLYRKEFAAIVCMILAATVHPTFILHAAILTIACMTVLMIEKQGKKATLLGALAGLLVLPVLLYVVLVLHPENPTMLAKAQSILVNERIPHHAKVSTWFSLAAVLKIAIIFAGIGVSFLNKRLFLLLIFCTLASIVLTFLQIITASTSLALLFPWRLSTWLVPICLAILLGGVSVLVIRVIDTWFPRKGIHAAKWSVVGICFIFATTSCVLGIKKTLNGALASSKNDVALYAKANGGPEQTYLIPLKYETFRLASGVPVFIDWKSHPYRDAEVIEWRDRIGLARAYYEAGNKEIATRAMTAIRSSAAITHVVVEVGQKMLIEALKGDVVFQDNQFAVVKLAN